MKRKRIFISFIVAMILSMQINIVSYASEDNHYYNIYGDRFLYREDYINSTDPVLKHFSQCCLPSNVYNDSSLRSNINTFLQKSNIDFETYPYYAVFLDGYNGILVRAFDSPDLLFSLSSKDSMCSKNVTSNITSSAISYSNLYDYKSYSSTLNSNYLYVYTSLTNGVTNYNKVTGVTKGAFTDYKSYCYLVCTNMNIYDCAELCNITVSDYGSNYFVMDDHCYKYYSKLTNLNSNFEYPYENADMDISSEGSNNALSQFTMCGVADSKYYSNYGLALNYALSDMAYNTYSKGKLCVDYTITIRMVEQNQNNVLPVKTLRCSQKYDVNGQSGSVSVDLFGLISNNMLSSVSDVVQYGAILRALNGTSVPGVVITKSDNINEFMHNNKFLKAINVNEFLDSVTYTYNDVVYTYVFDTFTVSAKAYVSNGSSSTNRRNAIVDLVKGSNNSYNYVGIDADSLSPDTSDVINNTNYFVNTDNGYRYYNSVTNEVKDCGDTPYVSLGDIVVNVDVDGGGSSGSMTQNNNVSFPDSIFIKFQDMNKVTIEDDDLTAEELAKRIKDGFGLIDDDSTPEYGDGFISMISDVYSGIDPNLKTIILYGISTTIGIAVIRMIFKR